MRHMDSNFFSLKVLLRRPKYSQLTHCFPQVGNSMPVGEHLILAVHFKPITSCYASQDGIKRFYFLSSCPRLLHLSRLFNNAEKSYHQRAPVSLLVCPNLQAFCTKTISISESLRSARDLILKSPSLLNLMFNFPLS